MANILVTGSKAGLGLDIANKLREDGHNVIDYDIVDGKDVIKPDLSGIDTLDILINNAGVNEISWLEDLEEERWDKIIDTNAKGMYMMSRACLPLLAETNGTILNIVSNAAHVPMRCSLAYNASKGAGHIMTKQLARELTQKWGITVFGVAPNRLEGTPMSDYIDEQVVETRGWTMEYAREYQVGSLLAGSETPPERVAEMIAWLLKSKRNHEFLTGCILPYGVQE